MYIFQKYLLTLRNSNLFISYTMKKLIVSFFVTLFCTVITTHAQTTTSYSSESKSSVSEVSSKGKDGWNYALYPTKNMWNFLKLDTRSGKIWQVQYDINGDSYGEVVVSDKDLTYGDIGEAGRFELYPTENMYNFLLLDKKDGVIVQVQWSLNPDNRGIVHFLSYGHYD